jgi:hypothetical protein
MSCERFLCSQLFRHSRRSDEPLVKDTILHDDSDVVPVFKKFGVFDRVTVDKVSKVAIADNPLQSPMLASACTAFLPKKVAGVRCCSCANLVAPIYCPGPGAFDGVGLTAESVQVAGVVMVFARSAFDQGRSDSGASIVVAILVVSRAAINVECLIVESHGHLSK